MANVHLLTCTADNSHRADSGTATIQLADNETKNQAIISKGSEN